jgi:transposase
MGNDTAEYELRCRAIKLRQQGTSFAQVLAQLGRGRMWLAKWWRRYRHSGWAGLKTQSRAPKRRPQSTPERVVAKVLAVRMELQSHRTRASRFAGIGAEAIRLELARRRVQPLPGLRTIERIVKRHHLSGRKPARRKGGGEPYPAPRARDPGDLQQTDLVGPRHLRGVAGLTRFYSFHTIALVGRAAATSQARHKSTEALCNHFLHAWSWLGLPRISQMDNEMAASGGGRYPYGFSLVMRLHLLLGVHLLFIPEGEPGRNAHIESFNDLWQERVLRHRCADLAALKRTDRGLFALLPFRQTASCLGGSKRCHALPRRMARAQSRRTAQPA